MRKIQLEGREHREREIELRRENRKLKARVEQEKLSVEQQRQEQARELAEFKESMAAQLTSKLDEYQTSLEREKKDMVDVFERELAKMKECRCRMLFASYI